MRSRPHAWFACLVLLGALALSAAGAARAESAAPAPNAASAAEAWRGRFCTPLGCAPRSGSPLAAAAGFALAVLAAGRLAGRPRA